VAKFKDRVAKLGNHQQGAAWKELSREAENILTPTLQLAAQIAAAYDEMRQQSSHLMTFTEARTDPLTSVFNRRGLDDTLRGHFSLMHRYHTMFSIAIFDIDHFKQVNDREGHVYGDRVLQELATLFEDTVRDTDIVARFGGEEFVVVMPQTELAGACTFAERLRLYVATRLSITVSGGVTMACESDTAESLIERADAALYAAKDAGRNRVFCRSGDTIRPVASENVPQESHI
jgi:diguanylate cyclase